MVTASSMKSFDLLRAELSAGTTTCERITSEYLRTIEEKKRLNAILAVFPEKALNQAKIIDKKLSNGTAGPLAGMVIAVKDVICMKDERVSCGSKLLENFISLYDATVIQRLQNADAVIIGKTNMDEFAMGSSTENSAYQRVKLPQDETRIPGGSSGGSAVAVQAGMSTTSLGSDTGGSIRQPAAFCGVIGLKPTYGRVSRFGLVAYASSFDSIGPFALTAKDAASVFQVIAGYDSNDSTSVKVPVPDYISQLTKNVKGLRIGIPKEYFGEALNSEIRQVIENKIDLLRGNGAVISEVSLPHTKYTVAAYYILATAEASSNLARYDGARYGYRNENARDLSEMYIKSRSEGFGTEVKRRIMLGTYVLSAGYYDAYYRKGQKVRRLIQEDFIKAFEKVDCLITPTAPSTAFKAGEKMDDPLQMYLSDIYTTSANLAGIPGISIPCGEDHQGLPIGMQILGPHFSETILLQAADFLETV
jgi:aspartyl-tRNA(Asn)/glutamyl-tRNA(Gln) amidotransferase subunit A